MAKSFTAELLPVPHGGHYVVVPKAIAGAAGLRHGQRVRGTVNGARYRSSLMMYSGVFHLGVHKATLAEAEVRPPAAVQVSIEADTEPLPTTGSEPEADDTAKHSGAEILVAEAEKAEKADEKADDKTEEAAQA